MTVDMKSLILNKLRFIYSVILIVFLLYLIFYFSVRGSSNSSREHAREIKKILFWNAILSDETLGLGAGDIFRHCPVKDCLVTRDRNYVHPLDFDAILFYSADTMASDVPLSRSPQQLFVIVKMENPANYPLLNHPFEQYYNISMTYRLDSDLVWTYGVVKDAATDEIVAPLRNTVWSAFDNRSDVWEDGERDESSLGTVWRKSKSVMWVVDNCAAKSGRLEYAKELSKHIDVDIYGKCGDHNCSGLEDCFGNIAERDYFFYLSFENALCEDFVTGTLYDALSYNVVPIVYGGADYRIFAPPQSHINVFHYDSPEELAEYLKWLMKNPEMYKKYFLWKQFYKIERGAHRATCDLCRFLHEDRGPRVFRRMFSEWFSQGRCPLQGFLSDQKYVTRATFSNKN